METSESTGKPEAASAMASKPEPEAASKMASEAECEAASMMASEAEPEAAAGEGKSNKRKIMLEDLVSKDKIVVQKLGSLRDYHTHNEFEKSVVSGCRNGVTLVKEFVLSKDGKSVYDSVFTSSYFTAWNREFKIPNGKYPSKEAVAMQVGQRFEIDLYMIPNDSVNLHDFLRDIFQGDLSNVFVLWPNGANLAKIDLKADESFYLEIGEPLRDIPKKLFQIERTMQLKDSCMGCVDNKTAAAAVVVNGIKEDVAAAVDVLRDDHQKRICGQGSSFSPLIDAIPIFIIFSPFRNLFTETSDIKERISSLETNLNKRLLWTMMDIDELQRECKKLGLTLPETVTVTRSALFSLLSTTLA